MSEAQGARPGNPRWSRLRSWIDQQEKWEQEHNSPAPLTVAQENAINTLMSDIQDTGLEDRNFVSELLEYAASLRIKPPTFEFEAIPFPSEPVRWRGSCNISGKEGGFPQAGWGIEPGFDHPLFQSKKRAKQFAAKYALAYLKSHVDSPQRWHSLNNKRVKLEESPPTDGKSGAQFSGQSIAQSIAQSSGQSSSESNISIIKKVEALAHSLNFDSPSYALEQDGSHGGDIWKGRPCFKNDSLIPPDMGVVTGVLGKKHAETMIAEKVFEWLQGERRKREETYAELMKSLGVAPVDI